MAKKTTGSKTDRLVREITLLRKDMKKSIENLSENWDQKFFELKSDIHNLIDYGFTSKAKAHDEEIDILNFRTSELRDNVDRLNTAVFHK